MVRVATGAAGRLWRVTGCSCVGLLGFGVCACASSSAVRPNVWCCDCSLLDRTYAYENKPVAMVRTAHQLDRPAASVNDVKHIQCFGAVMDTVTYQLVCDEAAMQSCMRGDSLWVCMALECEMSWELVWALPCCSLACTLYERCDAAAGLRNRVWHYTRCDGRRATVYFRRNTYVHLY